MSFVRPGGQNRDGVSALAGSIHFGEEDKVLLEGKCAVVYGAGGTVGAAVAKAFAAEGARVALTGRSVERLEMVTRSATQAARLTSRSSTPSTVANVTCGQVVA